MSRDGYSTIDELAGQPSAISLSPQFRHVDHDHVHAEVTVGCCAARRWMLVAFAFVAVAINYSDRTNISVAIITMADEFRVFEFGNSGPSFSSHRIVHTDLAGATPTRAGFSVRF
jgi:accessory gene regulator protein AgrB